MRGMRFAGTQRCDRQRFERQGERRFEISQVVLRYLDSHCYTEELQIGESEAINTSARIQVRGNLHVPVTGSRARFDLPGFTRFVA